MVTIHREHGFRFVIYVDDHGPAHVHVRGDGEMKVFIRGEGGLPDIAYSVGVKTRDRRRVMDVVHERQEQFLSHWAEIHGDE